MKRLRELDFLRGVAIVLVLFRHQNISEFTTNMGWIGVDLFFVLSGFLVSGLLFKEYLKFGDIQPKRFLIRRAFKIYPVYFLFYPLYLIPIILNGDFNIRGFISDMTFLQNYIYGFGFAYAASWSLAVEEHFYFGFSLLLWFGLRYDRITLNKIDHPKFSVNNLETIIVATIMLCLILRLLSNIVFPTMLDRNFTMTHLRIDSLLAGVLISYFYYFKNDTIKSFFLRHKLLLYSIAFLGLIWTPFVEPFSSFFVPTFGFTFLYISFAILLIHFLLDNEVNQKLNKVFSAPVVNVISKIGYCSYSIYIIHTFVNISFAKIILTYNLSFTSYSVFFITSLLSVLFGMVMTYVFERYFLKIRDKYYPSRVR